MSQSANALAVETSSYDRLLKHRVKERALVDAPQRRERRAIMAPKFDDLLAQVDAHRCVVGVRNEREQEIGHERANVKRNRS